MRQRQLPAMQFKPSQHSSPWQSSYTGLHVGVGVGTVDPHFPLVQVLEQHSSGKMQSRPSAVQDVGSASEVVVPPSPEGDPHFPSRQMLPAGQSVSTLHAASVSSQAANAANAIALETRMEAISRFTSIRYHASTSG